ncbi:MAG: serine protease [Solobacterium sp.]|nr:serine protease [Solobacterium sp.]
MKKQIGFLYTREDEQEICFYRQVFSKQGYRPLNDLKDLYLCDAVLFLCNEGMADDPVCREALDTCLKRDIPVILAHSGRLPAEYDGIRERAYDAAEISFDDLKQILYPKEEKKKPENERLMNRLSALFVFLLVTAAVLLIVFMSPGKDSRTRNMEEILLERYGDACVQVWSIGSFEDAVYRGSGFAVSADGYIVTNAHVIDHPSSRCRVIIGEKAYTAEVEAVSAENDIALLKADAHLPAVLQFSSEDTAEGTDVYTIGYPENDGRTAVSGTYDGTRVRSEAGVTYEVICCRLRQGSSGSPVMTEDGGVIGIAAATSTEHEGTGLIIPKDICTGFLKEYIFIP